MADTAGRRQRYPFGSTIGILGDGQLGRMLAQAAAQLGYRVHIFGPAADGPAMQVAAARTIADYDDAAALAEFANAIDIATFEFENIPSAAAAAVAEIVPLAPNLQALEIAQDRRHEKRFATDCGFATAPYHIVTKAADLQGLQEVLQFPALMKTCRLGYDGKGQIPLAQAEAARDAWQQLGQVPVLIEQRIDFAFEVSILAARGQDGSIATYPPVRNEHRQQILHRSLLPAGVDEALARQAIGQVSDLLSRMDYVGVLAVEFFATENGQLLFNEMAPRVHNSGHWSIEGAATSQFEQHVRALCGLPLGSTRLLGQVEMTNLIGDDVTGAETWLAREHCHLHLYGKADIRPGRKMGHVTRLVPFA